MKGTHPLDLKPLHRDHCLKPKKQRLLESMRNHDISCAPVEEISGSVSDLLCPAIPVH